MCLFKKNCATIVRCVQCGFIFVNPRYSQSDVPNIYSDWFDASTSGNNERKNYDETEVGDKSRFKKDIEVIETFKLPGILLDIGCGLGYFLDAGVSRGWKVYGLDASGYAIDVCQSKGHGNVQSGLFSASRYTKEQFDVITAFDVFEHVLDPNVFLRDAFSLLKDDGLLVLAVPNVRSMGGRFLGKRWSQYIIPEHLNFFSTVTIKKILNKNGFSVIETYSEPSVSIGLRTLIKRWGGFTKVVDAITLFKSRYFYPPVNFFARKFGLEANLLKIYAKKTPRA